jgi:hypothetical protein
MAWLEAELQVNNASVLTAMVPEMQLVAVDVSIMTWMANVDTWRGWQPACRCDHVSMLQVSYISSSSTLCLQAKQCSLLSAAACLFCSTLHCRMPK